MADNGRLRGLLLRTRFRNLLVHGYAVVDEYRVIEILKTNLEDLDEFRRSLARAATD